MYMDGEFQAMGGLNMVQNILTGWIERCSLKQRRSFKRPHV